jgi:hypothetical protein
MPVSGTVRKSRTVRGHGANAAVVEATVGVYRGIASPSDSLARVPRLAVVPRSSAHYFDLAALTWQQDREQWQSAAIVAKMTLWRRSRALGYLDTLRDPGHPGLPAWLRELAGAGRPSHGTLSGAGRRQPGGQQRLRDVSQSRPQGLEAPGGYRWPTRQSLYYSLRSAHRTPLQRVRRGSTGGVPARAGHLLASLRPAPARPAQEGKGDPQGEGVAGRG